MLVEGKQLRANSIYLDAGLKLLPLLLFSLALSAAAERSKVPGEGGSANRSSVDRGMSPAGSPPPVDLPAAACESLRTAAAADSTAFLPPTLDSDMMRREEARSWSAAAFSMPPTSATRTVFSAGRTKVVIAFHRTRWIWVGWAMEMWFVRALVPPRHIL
jgi:hypothetical protein